MYETILVPIDGSEHAIRAGEHARYLAHVFSASVHLVSVADVQAMGGTNGDDLDEAFVERIEAEHKRAIETSEEIFQGDSIETAVLRGAPADAIVDYADSHSIDVIAMGTQGRTGVGRYLAGSVTESVVRRAPCPVLTTVATERSQLDGDYDDLLIPTDGSEPAAAAVSHGIAIAEAIGARIHAVNIIDADALAPTPEHTAPKKLLDRFEAEGERTTGEIATRATNAGVDVTTSVREGYPTRDLLAYADAHNIDLIAMGTTGQTNLNRYLLGSTAERVIRHAEVPVLAVNARESMKR